MGETHVFKTLFSKVFPFIFAGITLLASVVVVAGDARELVRSVPFLCAASLIVWALYWSPRVEVTGAGITLINVVRIVHIPWPCFTSADPRWNLRIDTTSGTYTSWALPAGSRASRLLPGRSSEPTQADPHPTGNTAGAAALRIGERLRALREAGRLSGAALGSPEVKTSWNRVTLVCAGASALLVVVGLV